MDVVRAVLRGHVRHEPERDHRQHDERGEEELRSARPCQGAEARPRGGVRRARQTAALEEPGQRAALPHGIASRVLGAWRHVKCRFPAKLQAVASAIPAHWAR